MTAVFDASAVLAILNREPGADNARVHLSGAAISTVNAAEVGAKLIDKGMPAEAAKSALELLRLKIAEFDTSLADKTVELRLHTRSEGLSLADRACLALAMREGATAITADRAWVDLDLACSIELIR